MKAAATLIVLVLASCATSSEPESAATEQTALTTRLLSVDTSCQWVPDRKCYGVANNGNSIWPADMGITSVQVLTRSGPDRLEHRQPTFLAFVVWNRTTVGRIFRIDVGSAAAADWLRELGAITTQRTVSGIDHSTGSTGGAGGGPVPPPHPQVDEAIVFDQPYLDAVKRYAGAVDEAGKAFLATKSAIDG